MLSVNSLIDKFDPRGSTFQILWSVTRANTRTERPVVLTMDGAQKYQLLMADYLKVDFWNLIPNMLGLELDNDPCYAQERSNVTFIGDLVHLPTAADVAMIHERYTQVRVMRNIAENLGFPTIYIEHHMPKRGYCLKGMMNDLGDAKVVFRTKLAQQAWGYDDSNSVVIHDGIVACKRKYAPTSNKWYTIHPHIDITHHPLWLDIRDEKLPFELRGYNGCMAYETNEAEEQVLVDRYTGYVNLQVDDPLPIDMLRACARGMPVMSVHNSEIDRCFKNQESIFIIHTLEDVRRVLSLDKKKLKEVGRNGQRVIENKFTVQGFSTAWEDIINATIYK
jgi:hypothetical protein